MNWIKTKVEKPTAHKSYFVSGKIGDACVYDMWRYSPTTDSWHCCETGMKIGEPIFWANPFNSELEI